MNCMAPFYQQKHNFLFVICVKVLHAIYDGYDAPYRPFYVMLECMKSDGVHTCGGAVIAPYMVITAAHCVHGMSLNISFFGNLL